MGSLEEEAAVSRDDHQPALSNQALKQTHTPDPGLKRNFAQMFLGHPEDPAFGRAFRAAASVVLLLLLTLCCGQRRQPTRDLLTLNLEL